MRRSDGARAWSTVLSELAQVKVSVEWLRPTWRVSWQDGPTREALLRRAAELGKYGVGAPLPVEDLRFAPRNSAVAIALAWLARGARSHRLRPRAAIPEVAAFCADTGYPQTRVDAGTLAAADLLRRVSHGDIAEMGLLLTQAVPPVPPSNTLVPGPDLTGRWSVTGGPPARPINCSGLPASLLSLGRTPPEPIPVGGAANR